MDKARPRRHEGRDRRPRADTGPASPRAAALRLRRQIAAARRADALERAPPGLPAAEKPGSDPNFPQGGKPGSDPNLPYSGTPLERLEAGFTANGRQAFGFQRAGCRPYRAGESGL